VGGGKKNQLFPLVKNMGAKYDGLPIMINREICLHNGLKEMHKGGLKEKGGNDQWENVERKF